MAPVEATVALSHVEGVSDAARARELYKYYQPPEASTVDKKDVCIEVPDTDGQNAEKESDAPKDISIASDVTSTKISSPDTALTAFCQLVTWRLGAQRAMISFIDADNQYFVAESTKTVDLNDNTKHAPGDEIWMGCSSVTKAGRLCERTIAVAPTDTETYPCFIVNDLSKDERFNTLPFVAGSPFLRFYAGVPLITKRKIPIGSLFIVDDRVGNGISDEKINFMGTMAQTIMRHMEMVREVEEHRRGMKMSRGLASFVEGGWELAEAEAEAEDGEGTKIVGQFDTESTISRTKSTRGSKRGSVHSVIGSVSSQEKKEKEYSAALSKAEDRIRQIHEHDSQKPRPALETPSLPGSYGTNLSVSVSSPRETYDKSSLPATGGGDEATLLRNLFSRAANLIREAFEVDGGAVFFEAQTGFSTDLSRKSDGLSRSDDNDSVAESFVADLSPDETGERDSDVDKTVSSPPFSPVERTLGIKEERKYSRTTEDKNQTVEVLGFSTPEASSVNSDIIPGPSSFSPFHERALVRLLRRYPKGKLWTFDTDGGMSSSTEEDPMSGLSRDPIQRATQSRRRRVRSAKMKSDAKYLCQQFPGVRQLLFVPLWDAGRSRWLSSCVVWSTEPTRILSKQSELSFLTAFGNSVMAEWSRIDTEIADQKKGDFIGSISHELRSPLHGILASAEFLAEQVTGWDKELVETIDSCGRTLLDTINHILDFSKINHFEKNWRKNKRSGNRQQNAPLSLQSSDIPMLNLFQEVDISVICEEVVESVFAGHVFQTFTARNFDDVAESHGKMSDNRKAILEAEQLMGPQKYQTAGVAVILDIDPHAYQFITQPGALRRLIMNLLGNSLKYTSHGYVKIRLEAADMEALNTATSGSGSSDSIPRSRVTLTISDTGKGITSEFIRSKLYMPFAQENSLSSGTGLGLSIVRKIVSLLDGDISIDSEVGVGTKVTVVLPLLREMPKTTESSGSTPRSMLSAPTEAEDSIDNLRKRITGQKFSLHGFDLDLPDPVLRESMQELKASVTKFLDQWYGMKEVPLGQRCNLIVSNEAIPSVLSSLIKKVSSTQKKHPAIIVLCSHSTKFDQHLEKDPLCHVGYVSKPLGPLKLARAITQCINGAPALPTPGELIPQPQHSDLSRVFEELSLGRSNEILDNTRMSANTDNARKALESPTPTSILDQQKEYPFPSSPTRPKVSIVEPAAGDPRIPERISSKQKISPTTFTVPAIAPTSVSKPAATPKAMLPPRQHPTILVVDDNPINVKLLCNFFLRSTPPYAVVGQAVDGQHAVQVYSARPTGYDIIFMDINMPILDGYQASRQIRAIELERKRASLGPEDPALDGVRDDAGTDTEGKTERRRRLGGALIIAFTGRSSMEDQVESIRAGIDLFLTKPVKFGVVGTIVENFWGNREREEKVMDAAAAPAGSAGRES